MSEINQQIEDQLNANERTKKLKQFIKQLDEQR